MPVSCISYLLPQIQLQLIQSAKRSRILLSGSPGHPFFTRRFTLWNHAAYKIRQIPRTTPVRFPMFLIPFVTNGYRNMNTPANPAMNNTILSHNFFNFPCIPPVFLHNSPFSGVHSMFIASKCIKMPSSILRSD